LTGTVVAFDERRGLGEIESEGEHYPFHCTAVADGSRVVSVGAEVEFVVAPGPAGRWEAAHIEPR
jgi:cold shock CspA family protein